MSIKLSTISRYGLRAMIELAKNKDKSFVSLREISEKQGIPLRYLENIMLKLSSSRLVLSSRGKGGGFTLVKDPSSIKISDIIKALEGDTSFVPCVDNPSLCPRTNCCETRPLWVELKEAFWKVLDSRKLSDLLK